MILYKTVDIKPYDGESFFDNHLGFFDMDSLYTQMILRIIDGVVVCDNKLRFRGAIVTMKDLSPAAKTALCMVNFPGFVFTTKYFSTKSLEKVLKLPTGKLFVDIKEPFPYWFQVDCETQDGKLLRDSADINIWYFGERK